MLVLQAFKGTAKLSLIDRQNMGTAHSSVLCISSLLNYLLPKISYIIIIT